MAKEKATPKSQPMLKPQFKAVPPAEKPVEEERAIAFPTKSRCLRCRSLNTKRTGDNGVTQYRECQQSVCRHKYSITGTPV